MKITYYKSVICPRCIPTSRFLKNLKKSYPDVEIEEIEILKNMKIARRAGIHSIPVIEIGERRYTEAPPMDEVLELLKRERKFPAL